MNNNSLKNNQEHSNSPLFQRAKAAVLSRDFTLAIRLLKRILTAEPNKTEILLELASVYVRANEDKKALEIYEPIKNEIPDNFDILMSLGGIYRRLNRYEESIAVLESALLTGSNIDTVKYSMGFTYKLMGEYEHAEDCFTDVIDINPNDVLAYNHLGTILSIQGKYDIAQKTFSRGLQVDPNHPILHLNACSNYLEAKNYSKAKKHCEDALRAKPGWPDAMTMYAKLLKLTNSSHEAQKVLKKAVSLNPKNVDMHKNLAEFYSSHDDYEKAEETYEEILRLEPDNNDIKIALARIYSTQKKYNEALDLYNEIENHVELTDETLMNMAKILIELGKMNEAMEKIKLLEKKYTDNISSLSMFSQFFIRNNEFKTAKEYLAKIKNLFPTETAYLFENAKQYNFMKQYLESKKLLDKYLPFNKQDSNAWHLNGDNLRELKLYPEALAALKTCFDLTNDEELYDDIIALKDYFPVGSAEADIIENFERGLHDGKRVSIDSGSQKNMDAVALFDNETDSETETTAENKDAVEGKIDTDENTKEPVFSLDTEEFSEKPYDEYEEIDLSELDNYNKTEEPVNLSTLVSDDEPVDYEPTAEDPLFDDLGKAYSQVNPIEDEDFMIVEDASDFEGMLDDDENIEIEEPVEEEEEEEEIRKKPKKIEKTTAPEEEEPIDTSDEIEFEDFAFDDEPQAETMAKESKPEKEEMPEVEEDECLEFLPDDIDCMMAEEIPDSISDTPPQAEYEDEAEKLEITINEAEEITANPVLDENIACVYEDPLDTLDYEHMFTMLGDIATEISNNEKKKKTESDPAIEEFDVDLSLFEGEVVSTEVKAMNKEQKMMTRVRKVVESTFDSNPVSEFSNSAEMFSELRNLYKSTKERDTLLDELQKENLQYVSERLIKGPGLLAAAKAMKETCF